MKGRPCTFIRFFQLGLVLTAFSGLAAPPTVSLINPRPPESSINQGDVVRLKADARDFDGTVTHVEFYEDTNLVGVATTAPFEGWWTNQISTTDHYFFTAVAVDDSMERSTSTVARVWSYSFGPRTLNWDPPAVNTQVGEWNTRDFNWRSGSQFTHFRANDSVVLNGPFRVFIGTGGLPGAVTPAVVRIQNATVESGDILTGSLEVQRALFTNYAGSLSFPGGTRVGASGLLTYSINQASNGAVVHFGTGPITLAGNARFEFSLLTNQWATLENDFGCSDISAPYTLVIAGMWRSNALARFTGTLNLSGRCGLEIRSGLQHFSQEGMRDPDFHEWAGPMVLDQTRIVQQLGMYLWGSYRSRGLLLSGDIRDGPGDNTNRLVLQTYAVPVIRLTGSNTYGHGTLIDSSPSAPQGWVEVAPNSSLGRGNVEVRGPLHLTGNDNISSNATVSVAGGRLIIDPGVKIRVSRVNVLGGPVHTVGLFTQTNAQGWVRSNGTLRLPAINLPPSATITSPVGGVELPADILQVQALVTDVDSYIDRVELYVNGALAETLTNAPYNFSVRSSVIGPAALQAVVYDDDGATNASPVVNVHIAPPRIDYIRHVETNIVALQFRITAHPGVVLEASDSLAQPAWTNLGTFSAASGPTALITFTNQIPEGALKRYYRLRTP